MVIFVKKDNKTNLWYVQNAIVIAGHVPILLHKNEIINIMAKTSPPPKHHYDVKRTNYSLGMPT